MRLPRLLHRLKAERGSVMIETAIVVIPLVWLLVAMLDAIVVGHNLSQVQTACYGNSRRCTNARTVGVGEAFSNLGLSSNCQVSGASAAHTPVNTLSAWGLRLNDVDSSSRWVRTQAKVDYRWLCLPNSTLSVTLYGYDLEGSP